MSEIISVLIRLVMPMFVIVGLNACDSGKNYPPVEVMMARFGAIYDSEGKMLAPIEN